MRALAKPLAKTVAKEAVRVVVRNPAKVVVNLHANPLVKRLLNRVVDVSEKELQLMSGTWRNKIISLCQ